jgi:predicted DNA-binding transcriptional regulator AlpA
MAEPETQREGGDDKLFTLSDISQKTGISMPTLQRYKKLYQGRIPSVGTGRKQRYPESALPVFDELRNENIGRRGRPRKDASAAAAPKPPARRGRPAGSGRKAAAAAAEKSTRGRGPGRPARRPGRPAKNAATEATAPKPAARRGRPPGSKSKNKGAAGTPGKPGNLMTLTQISEQTGISYPTLVRYVRLHSDRLPHEGKGRARRFYPQAVDAFRELRQESGRGGRKPGRPAGSGRAAAGGRGGRAAAAGGDTGGFAQRIKAIEKAQQSIEKRFRGLADTLQKLFR